MEEICEHCSPISDMKSEFEEWAENGCQKAAEIIKNTKDEANK